MSDEVEKVAIIGMSGTFPGADDIGQLWELLQSGREGIATLDRQELLDSGERPELVDDPAYRPRGGFVSQAETFDPEFFGISPAEALAMDPQQRQFLMHSYLALEDAGRLPATLDLPVGVFGGESATQYWFMLREGPYSRSLEDFRLMLGNEKDFLATRTAYNLNLKGPAMGVQTACSTSLVAVGLACQSLLTWNCDLALAGGATIYAPRRRGYLAYKGMIASPSGSCRPFDHRADGTLFGEGVGVVCLKRLSEAVADGDYIYAVIGSVAMNNDGADKVGFTAPSVNGQAEVVSLAQHLADVAPDDIGYVEAHGTATVLGDPIEVQALTQAFRQGTRRTGFCHLGSLKANIGHLDAAAGIASLIKTALVVNTGVIPPQANFEAPNPHIDLQATPFLVNRETRTWAGADGRRVAGVSSFGIGGTNVHAILESAPRPAAKPAAQAASGDRGWPPLLLSARNPESLRRLAAGMADALRQNPTLPVAGLLAKQARLRTGFDWRRAVPGLDRETLLRGLSRDFEARPLRRGAVAFAFPGQGSQFPAMARAWHGALPVFTGWVDRGVALADGAGFPDARRWLFEDQPEAELARTDIAQPLLYIVGHALAQELMSRGLAPDFLVGHSAGEFVAATVGGALDFADGLRLVIARGRLMARAGAGAMLAVAKGHGAVREFLAPGLHVALCNGAGQTVISGSAEAIAGLESRLGLAGVTCRRLAAGHGFHSPMMDSVAGEFAAVLAGVRWRVLEIPMVANIDGRILRGGIDWPAYWLRQLVGAIRFDLCLQTLAAEGAAHFVECGPGKALSGMARAEAPGQVAATALMPGPGLPAGHVAETVAALWEAGAEFDWGLSADRGREPILLPGYPFARQRFWPAAAGPTRHPGSLSAAAGYGLPPASPAPVPQTRLGDAGQRDKVRAIWREILGHGDFGDDRSFFLCGGDSFAGIQLVQKLSERLGLELTLPQLMLAPTVDGIAALLEKPAQAGPGPRGMPVDASRAARYLFPIQVKGDAPILFMVAGAHDNRYFDPETMKNSYEEDFYRYFSALIAALGDRQPLFGFRPKGLVMVEPQHSSVSAMAEAYIRAMKTVQPEGPYFIGGECVGGIVAQEMACRLEAMGETVGRLFLLDTPRPHPATAMREMADMIIRNLQLELRDAKRQALAHGPAQLGRKLRLWLQFIGITLLPVSGKARRQRRGLDGSRVYQNTLLTHRARPFHGRTTLIINRVWGKQYLFMGWRHELGPELDVHVVPGPHESRLAISAALIGQLIRDGIRRGQSRAT